MHMEQVAHPRQHLVPLLHLRSKLHPLLPLVCRRSPLCSPSEQMHATSAPYVSAAHLQRILPCLIHVTRNISVHMGSCHCRRLWSTSLPRRLWGLHALHASVWSSLWGRRWWFQLWGRLSASIRRVWRQLRGCLCCKCWTSLWLCRHRHAYLWCTTGSNLWRGINACLWSSCPYIWSDIKACVWGCISPCIRCSQHHAGVWSSDRLSIWRRRRRYRCCLFLSFLQDKKNISLTDWCSCNRCTGAAAAL